MALGRCIHIGSVAILDGVTYCRHCGDTEQVIEDPFDKNHPYRFAELA